MGRDRVRGGVRRRSRVSASAPKHWPDGFWRPYAVPSSFLRDPLDTLEYPHERQESATLLGSNGVRRRHVVLHASTVDLLRSLFAAGGTEPIHRRCRFVSACRADDGRISGAAARSTKRTLAPVGIDRFFSTAHVVAIPLLVYRDSVAVCLAERNGVWP